MYVDAQTLLSNAQAFTASAASTNVLNTGNTTRHGAGEPVAVILTVDVAADNTTGNEAYTIALQSASDAAFTTPVTHSSVVAAAGSGAVTFAAGARYILPIPPGDEVLQYIRLYATLAGTTPTITITAFVTLLSMAQNEGVYPDAITIS